MMISRRTIHRFITASLLLALAWGLAAFAQAFIFATYLPVVLNVPLPTPLSPARLLISEVMYDPVGDEPGGEWIELFNPGSQAYPLTGVKIGDAERRGKIEGMFSFPEGSRLDAGAILVVASNARQFKASYGKSPEYELNDSDPLVPDLIKYDRYAIDRVELVNTGDEVLLLNPQDQVLDAVSWGSSALAFDPPVRRVAEGHTVERFPAHIDTDRAQDWRDRAIPAPWSVDLSPPTPTTSPLPSTPGGQPSPSATVYRTPEPTPTSARLLISEVMYSCSWEEPFCEWIELYNAGGASLDLSTVCLGDQVEAGSALNDGRRCFPPGSQLASGQVIVIAMKGAILYESLEFKADYEMLDSGLDYTDMLPDPAFGPSVKLENLGDEVVLVDAQGGLLDFISWGSSTAAFSPALPLCGADRSAERYPPVEDHDTAQDWRCPDSASPGTVQYP